MAKRDDRRAQILARAREVFAQHGYHATKVDDVVAAAGIARGTFYLYFGDKRSLFGELVDQLSQRINAAIHVLDPSDSTRTLEAQIRENIGRVLAVLLEDRAMTKIFLADVIGVDPAFDGKLMSFYESIGRYFEETLALGQELGLVRRADPRLLAFFTIGGLKEVLYQIVTRNWAYELDAMIDAIYGLLRTGYIMAGEASRLQRPLLVAGNGAK